MKHSELSEAMARAFGSAYAESVARDHVLGSLGGRSAQDALAAGVSPKQVWHAVCDAFDFDDSLRWSYREDRRKR